MPAPNLSDADFQRAFQALLPRGRVWNRDPGSTQGALAAGLTKSLTRLTQRANNLLIDAFPATTYELLPEWEDTLGLPDPCAGPAPSTQVRRNQVVARLTNTGGQSAAYFIGLAQKLGYGITITNFAPFRCGQSTCGQALGNQDWFFTWAVNALQTTVVRFAAGRSAAGDPLASWGNRVLECEISAMVPAHTILQFRYQ